MALLTLNMHGTRHSRTHLIVNAFVKEHTQRPPVNLARISFAFVNLWRQVRKRPRLASQGFVRGKVGGNVLKQVSWQWYGFRR